MLTKNHNLKIIYSISLFFIFCSSSHSSDVQKDLINYFDKLVPMNNELYFHTTEGKDDMPAHIKSALTNNQISLSIKNSELLIGTWQGLYLFEHRLEPHNRTIIHHFIGD